MTYFRLPDKDDMLTRMNEFNPSADRLNEMFAEHGGTEITPILFVILYGTALAEFARDLPKVMVPLMETAMPMYARHLIDDPDALTETLQLLDVMGIPVSR